MDSSRYIFLIFWWISFHCLIISYANICPKEGIMLRIVLKFNKMLTNKLFSPKHCYRYLKIIHIILQSNVVWVFWAVTHHHRCIFRTYSTGYSSIPLNDDSESFDLKEVKENFSFTSSVPFSSVFSLYQERILFVTIFSTI